MEVTLKSKDSVWRGRGAPRRVIPPEIKALADQTYKTGKVGYCEIAPEEEEEARELKTLLNSYARSLGRLMRIQHEDGIMRFEMVDKPRGAK